MVWPVGRPGTRVLEHSRRALPTCTKFSTCRYRMGAGRVPVDERLPRVASTYYPSTTTTHYGRAPSMVWPVGRPGTRVFEKSSTYRCTISRYKIGTGRVLAHSCCVYTAVHSTEKLYSTGTLPIYLYMRAITHRPRSLGWE